MAKSTAERVSDFRERRRQEKEAIQRKAEIRIRKMMETPFSQWLENDGNYSSVEMAFDMMGIEPPSFHDESNPESLSGEIESSFINQGRQEESPYYIKKGALGRAELMMDCLINAAIELSSIINTYKRQELSERRQKIETSDLSDPVTRHKALADIVQVQKMLDQLDKPVRRSFAQWNVKE